MPTSPKSEDPIIKPLGEYWYALWPSYNLTLEFTRLVDRRDAVSAYVRVTNGAMTGVGIKPLVAAQLNLVSVTSQRGLVKSLEEEAPGLSWRRIVDRSCVGIVDAFRRPEPFEILDGAPAPPTREVIPKLLYEGEPTAVFADGDTGKSLFAAAIAVAVQTGMTLPFGLRPSHAAPVVYLDWETDRSSQNERVRMIANGLGVDTPPILYKRMTRPLVTEIYGLAADCAKHRVGLVIVDSKMFAVGSFESAAFHEPITAFYNALRRLAPAAVLVLNHVTNLDAKNGGPARPFGGAFAFNGPRLIWEAKRDREVSESAAIAFTCIKANNMPNRPPPFGLQFQYSRDAITIYPFDLTEASPEVLSSAPLSQRVLFELEKADLTATELGERLGINDPKGKRIRLALDRHREKGLIVSLVDTKPQRWHLVARVQP